MTSFMKDLQNDPSMQLKRMQDEIDTLKMLVRDYMPPEAVKKVFDDNRSVQDKLAQTQLQLQEAKEEIERLKAE